MLLGALPALAAGCMLLFQVINRIRWAAPLREEELFAGLALLIGSAFTGYFVIATWRKHSERNNPLLLDLPTEKQKANRLSVFQRTAGVFMLTSAVALLVFCIWAYSETLKRAKTDYFYYGPSLETKLLFVAMACLSVCMMLYAIATFRSKRHSL